MILREEATVSHRVGAYTVSRNESEMTLQIDNQGEMSLKGCLLFVFTMVCVLTLGVLSVVQSAQTPQRTGMDDPSRLLAPQENHFGFLWLAATGLMLIGIPVYVLHTYKSTLTYTFRRGDSVFLKNGRKVTTWDRIEYVSLRESRDTDNRYLYLLHLVYNDGLQTMLYNGYDEREVMNLANEIAVYSGSRVVWK